MKRLKNSGNFTSFYAKSSENPIEEQTTAMGCSEETRRSRPLVAPSLSLSSTLSNKMSCQLVTGRTSFTFTCFTRSFFITIQTTAFCLISTYYLILFDSKVRPFATREAILSTNIEFRVKQIYFFLYNIHF